MKQMSFSDIQRIEHVYFPEIKKTLLLERMVKYIFSSKETITLQVPKDGHLTSLS